MKTATVLALLSLACVGAPPPGQVTECAGALLPPDAPSPGRFRLVTLVSLDDLAASSTVSLFVGDAVREAYASYATGDAGWLRAPVEIPLGNDEIFFSLDRDAVDLAVVLRRPGAAPVPWAFDGACGRGTWER